MSRSTSGAAFRREERLADLGQPLRVRPAFGADDLRGARDSKRRQTVLECVERRGQFGLGPRVRFQIECFVGGMEAANTGFFIEYVAEDASAQELHGADLLLVPGRLIDGSVNLKPGVRQQGYKDREKQQRHARRGGDLGSLQRHDRVRAGRSPEVSYK
jgi:hypothetical protein